MATKTYLIPNISCAHCLMHITNRLNEIEGLENVEGDVTSKEITVEFSEPANDEAIIAALEEINYPPRR
ncbi:MAG TPA: heavy metal transporter [Anaerolineaceae bacterium]|nr:heavy metal transporter [Anaerolineaceae bacterium]